MVLPDVDAEVAPLLGLVRAVGALVGWRLAAALHVLVPAQGGLPAVLLAAVAALELPARVVRVVPVALVEVRLGVVEGVAGADGGVGLVRVVEGVGLLGQHDVVGVVVLAVGLGLLLLAGLVVQRRADRVVVLHERLLQQVRLDVLGDGAERVQRQLGQVREGRVLGRGLEDVGDLDAGRHERRQRLRLRVLHREEG